MDFIIIVALGVNLPSHAKKVYDYANSPLRCCGVYATGAVRWVSCICGEYISQE